MEHNKNDKLVFWGCFIALITTSMAFIFRAILIGSGVWPEALGIDAVQANRLFGAGLWPFAISIILFSLFIDYVGYRFAMLFSFVCYAGFAVLALMGHSALQAGGADAQAAAWNYLYWGSVVLGLGNGTVEAFINPVVATIYKDEKSKWLNILHAGWPAGLVVGGIIAIGLHGAVSNDWRILLIFMFAPAIIYVIMLFKVKFPVNERVAAGSSYRQMLAEFGAVGAFIASYLIFRELAGAFPGMPEWLMYSLIAVSTIGFGVYCRSFGNPLLIVLVIIMMPLAITELGTDGAISGLMEGAMEEAGWNPAWVLVYTSAIMMVLRFFAGPVIKALTPLGLLMACSALAIVGLFMLSKAAGLIFIFGSATVYAVAKTYFWPTMLGVASEQTPRGGALTLNAIAGIGMLAVGIVGGPIIGMFQEGSVTSSLKEEMPQVYSEVTTQSSIWLGEYTALDGEAVAKQPEEAQAKIETIREHGAQAALTKMTIFPAIMLIGYIGLFLYFKSKGGYKPKVLEAAH
ncbi:MAG: MFS transporter [Verrucomicrobiota bacterium]